MSVNKYINGELLQLSGNADTRLTTEDIINILGYTPVSNDILVTTYPTTEYVNNNFVKNTDIINGLSSSDTDKPLSANQGKVLSEVDSNLQTQIDTLNSNIGIKKAEEFTLVAESSYTTSGLLGTYIVISNQGAGVAAIGGMAFLVATKYSAGFIFLPIVGYEMFEKITAVRNDDLTVTFANPNTCSTYVSIYKFY